MGARDPAVYLDLVDADEGQERILLGDRLLRFEFHDSDAKIDRLTLVLRNHDRFFLDRVCTHLLVFEGEGVVRWFEGNFDDYERWRKEELGAGRFKNRRSKYRKLAL